MAQFKVGDVVELKSGGPAMTVEGIDPGTGRVVCKWFVKNEERTGQFLPDTLAPCEPGPGIVVG